MCMVVVLRGSCGVGSAVQRWLAIPLTSEMFVGSSSESYIRSSPTNDPVHYLHPLVFAVFGVSSLGSSESCPLLDDSSMLARPDFLLTDDE
jgi:hypothetical protein